MRRDSIKKLDQELIDKIKELIERRDKKALKEIIDCVRPADLADLIEHLDSDERFFIFDLLEPKGAGKVLVEMESPIQEDILNLLDIQYLSKLIEGLESDEAADIVGDLSPEKAKEVIDSVEEELSEDLRKLLPYPEDTAGGLMALEYVAVREDATVQDAIEKIREMHKEVKNVYYLFVVDSDDKLVGVVSLKDLVVEPPDRKIKEIMNPDVISVRVDTDQEEIYHIVKKYNLVAIPVVDEKGRLVGRITHDDVIDVIERETDEDINLMAGIINQEIAEDSPLKISKARLPWLMGALFGEIVAAFVISRFESSLNRIIALSFFIPVIMAMGGATGNQAATIVVRGLATGDITLLGIGKRVWLEIRASILNGIICGIILGFVVSIWLKDPKLGSIVAFILVVIIFNAGFIGTLLPLVLKRLNIDPALAVGPFIATSNDILGLFIYLGSITLFMSIS